MLYDTRWDAKTETKADPLSLDSLIAWLEKQPADEAYDYCDPDACMLGQWLAQYGGACVALDDSCHGYVVDGQPQRFDHFAEIAKGGRRTFGAALDRARKLRGAY